MVTFGRLHFEQEETLSGTRLGKGGGEGVREKEGRTERGEEQQRCMWSV